MQIIYARQPFPNEWTSAIFLVGPTPRDPAIPSWRPEALRLLEEAGYDGVVMVPEPEDGIWDSGTDAFIGQVSWEREGLDLADVVLCWVPRGPGMPALTTNVEFGRYLTSGKVVFGAPKEAESVRYLEKMLETDVGGTRHLTLDDTVQATVGRVRALLAKADWDAAVTPRVGGARGVPLHIWTTPSFQSWYQAQVAAGNRLDDARLLWHFTIPKIEFVFSWVLHVKVWVTAEGRHKSNEYIFARSDISTTCLYHHPDSWTPGSRDRLLGTEIVLIREFRSPARTPDGMAHELPGGSSLPEKAIRNLTFSGPRTGSSTRLVPDDYRQVASDETYEETGLTIPATRFRKVRSRQLAATLSTHHAHLFCAELTASEMAQAKALAAAQVVQGNVEETERTYVEVTTVSQMLAAADVDWTTVGMIMQALLG